MTATNSCVQPIGNVPDTDVPPARDGTNPTHGCGTRSRTEPVNLRRQHPQT
jgi:hypothetical protein